MTSQAINRFEWSKAVMQSEALNATAKLVASAMAIQFANDETGQLNPSVKTLAEYIKASVDTVKRAVKSLVEAGWLGRTEGRGRGNKTTYRLASPGKVITLSGPKNRANQPEKKGGNAAPLGEEKGANLRGKGGKPAPSYIEQSFEQKGAALELSRSWTFTGRNFKGPVLIFPKDRHRLEDWGRFLKSNGFCALASIPLKRTGKRGQVAYAMPWQDVPDDPGLQREAIAYFAALLDTQEVRHAAQ